LTSRVQIRGREFPNTMVSHVSSDDSAGGHLPFSQGGSGPRAAIGGGPPAAGGCGAPPRADPRLRHRRGRGAQVARGSFA